MIYTESSTSVDEMDPTSPAKTPSSADLPKFRRTRSATQDNHLGVQEYLDDVYYLRSGPMVVYRPPHSDQAVYYSFRLFCAGVAVYLRSDTGSCMLTDEMIAEDPRPSTGTHLVVDAARKVWYVSSEGRPGTEAKIEVRRLVDGRVVIDNPGDMFDLLLRDGNTHVDLRDSMNEALADVLVE